MVMGKSLHHCSVPRHQSRRGAKATKASRTSGAIKKGATCTCTGRLGQEPGSDCLDEDICNYQSTFENISEMNKSVRKRKKDKSSLHQTFGCLGCNFHVDHAEQFPLSRIGRKILPFGANCMVPAPYVSGDTDV